jgi:hypothetical protein
MKFVAVQHEGRKRKLLKVYTSIGVMWTGLIWLRIGTGGELL